MRRFSAAAALVLLLSFGLAGTASAQSPQPNAEPVDHDATPAARALLRGMDGISGHATLSGQHNFPNSVSRYSDRIYDLTGSFPALFGQDFGFAGGEDKDSVLGRPAMIAEAIRQYRAGSVIALTWHAVRPTDDEPVTFRDSVQGHLTDWEWKQVLTPGTDLYNRWCRQVDVIAGYLLELQDAGVPVLFRPYHEMNGNWFWWGGRPGPDGSAALYRQIYNRFVHVHRLNNVVWVWNVNSPSANAGAIEGYYPGDGYADVLSMDIYSAFDQAYYDSMIGLAGPTRPIALAEVGAMPTLDVLARQPRWTYFMMWSGVGEGANTPEQLAAMFHAPNVIDRGDPRLPAPQPAPAAPPLPITPDAIPAAKTLFARLFEAGNKVVLSGQQLVPVSASSAPSAAEPSSEAATGKPPGLVEISLDGTSDKPLLTSIRDAAKSGQIVLLRWAPPRPADGALTGALTDFEWQELLRPGTDLNTRWMAQCDAVAALLKQLQQEHIAVLWSPYPQPNTHSYWWAGRPGPEGSAALVRLLYERLTTHDGLHNLIWIWEPASPGFGPGGNGGLADYYPGSLYADALTLDVESVAPSRFRADRMLSNFAGGKPVGLRIASGSPAPSVLEGQTGWQWIVLPPAESKTTAAP